MRKLGLSRTMILNIVVGLIGFVVLFDYLKIPSSIPDIDYQFAYIIVSVIGTLYGPLASCFVAFFGHILAESMVTTSLCWNWIIASGICGLIMGINYFYNDFQHQKLTKTYFVLYNCVIVLACFVAWGGVAVVLDMLFTRDSFSLITYQALLAASSNAFITMLGASAILLISRFVREKIFKQNS